MFLVLLFLTFFFLFKQSECLLQVKDGILEKFLQGFMKPSNKSNETEKKEEISDEEGSKNNGVLK